MTKDISLFMNTASKTMHGTLFWAYHWHKATYKQGLFPSNIHTLF